jgi:hypothetical protein
MVTVFRSDNKQNLRYKKQSVVLTGHGRLSREDNNNIEIKLQRPISIRKPIEPDRSKSEYIQTKLSLEAGTAAGI